MTTLEGLDPYDATLALRAEGLLAEFNRAGILSTSDIHVARRLAGLCGTTDESARLGAALAARAPRLGHVCVDLATIRHTASTDTESESDLAALPWPEPGAWVHALRDNPMVGVDRPLRLSASTLYLDRLWADESLVAAQLLERAGQPVESLDEALLAAGLGRLFPGGEDPDLQLDAARTAVRRRLSVIAGGPGTGKTTTVARVLALLDEQASAGGLRPPLVALAAPTGKAAARLEEAVRGEAARLDVDAATRQRLRALEGATLHRLLGFNPGNRTRFRHDRRNHLPHDVVVVDETSMVSLSMMARLTEAVRPEARLVLVGDPEQLASVEAGAVLGDIVGPAAERAGAAPGRPVIGEGITVLHRVHRYGGAIATLAEAVQRGDADAALDVLETGGSNVEWIAADGSARHAADELGEVRARAVAGGRAVIDAARAGRARDAIAALGSFRLLCAHRHGPEGVATWMHHVEDWLRAEVHGFAAGSEWYVGRPLIVTENDYGLRLYNGDTGVVVEAEGGRLVAAFERADAVVHVSPMRLAAVDTVYAMTVHKSQGSQFADVAFVLPGVESRLLTRELLYTAVTRAQERLIVVGTEEAIRTAVARPIARASGLRSALWGDPA